MKIEFFETDNGMDPSAIKDGVYHIELIDKNDEEKRISLYVGESVWIASRCGEHIYSLYENPSYFGLEPKDLDRQDLILRFSVLKNINERKSVLGVGNYKDLEMEYIQKYQPLTQLQTSDRQLTVAKKIKCVQEKISEMWG